MLLIYKGKVPAIVVRNYPGIDDCIIYESQAIVEWLDEQFPNTNSSCQLYGNNKNDRLRIKM